MKHKTLENQSIPSLSHLAESWKKEMVYYSICRRRMGAVITPKKLQTLWIECGESATLQLRTASSIRGPFFTLSLLLKLAHCRPQTQSDQGTNNEDEEMGGTQTR